MDAGGALHDPLSPPRSWCDSERAEGASATIVATLYNSCHMNRCLLVLRGLLAKPNPVLLQLLLARTQLLLLLLYPHELLVHARLRLAKRALFALVNQALLLLLLRRCGVCNAVTLRHCVLYVVRLVLSIRCCHVVKHAMLYASRAGACSHDVCACCAYDVCACCAHAVHMLSTLLECCVIEASNVVSGGGGP